jgi:hypothetical protein
LGDASYDSIVVDVERLAAATDETPFDEAAFEVLAELAQSVAVVACLQRQEDGHPRQ